MSRPVIGITTYAETARWGVWNCPAVLVPADYVRQVGDAGGIPVLLPPRPEDVEVLDRLDGLVVAGGADVDPERYGADRDPRTGPPRPDRDAGELALLARALERDVPVLAICRGSQVLNVARGGDLVQHLPDVVGDERHRHTPGVFADHDVAVEPDTRLGSLLGDHAPVKSHHHQGFGRLGSGLREAARADDGTVEALEDPSQRFAIGVLWHPEAGEDLRLFEELVEHARRYHEERGRA